MANVIQTNAGSFIPASQRPDGTWRKARRVKDGYVPQEEVPLYESKGKQWANQKPDYPVGLNPELIKKVEAAKISEDVPVPKPKKKKKKKPAAELPPEPIFVIEEPFAFVKNQKAKSAAAPQEPEPVKVSQPKVVGQEKAKAPQPKVNLPDDDQALKKKLKNLKRKLREINLLEQKINNKEIQKPEKDQLDKLSRKKEVLAEIEALSLLVNEDE